jgi:hypothetical protein
MNIIPDYWFLASVVLYVVGFVILGEGYNRGFFKMNPQKDISIEKLVEHTERQKTTSFTLAGFALAALTFIMSFLNDNPAKVEFIIAFFGLAFIFEIISAFLYQNLTQNRFSYLGMIFQYAGMFSVLVGFWSYGTNFMNWSMLVLAIFISGAFVFVGLTAYELKHYIEYWKNRNNG